MSPLFGLWLRISCKNKFFKIILVLPLASPYFLGQYAAQAVLETRWELIANTHFIGANKDHIKLRKSGFYSLLAIKLVLDKKLARFSRNPEL